VSVRRAASLVILLTAGCGGPRSSPEGAVTSFLDALDARDTARFRSSFTPGTREIVADIERLSSEVGVTTGQPAITIEEWCRAFCGGAVDGSTLDGDSATVQVRVGGVVEEFPLLRQDNEWRIDLAAKYAPAVEMLRLIEEEEADTPSTADTVPAAP
jgi:hypothetical protein